MSNNSITGGFNDKQSAGADALVEKMIDGSIYDIEDHDELTAAMTALGKTLASKFVFAYFGKEDEDDEFPVWTITPAKIWKEEGVIFDGPCPIHALLPEDADDLNDCGSWAWEDDMPPAERAKDLATRGFIWDKELQKINSVDAFGNESDQADIDAVTNAMEELRATTAPKPSNNGPT